MDKNYITGVMDSGCSITVEKDGSCYRVCVTLTRVSKKVIMAVHELSGGRVFEMGGSWRLVVKGSTAAKFLRQMDQMLTKKREREIVRQIQQYRSKQGYEGAREMLWKAIRGEVEWFSEEEMP